jgi:hypothetical protein
MPPPSFTDQSTAKMAKQLSLLEETKLKETSALARSDMIERYQRVTQQVAKNRQVTASDVLAFTVCSACRSTLSSVKNETPDHSLSSSVSSGLVCINDKCTFYLKIIPVNKIPELTNVMFIQQITVATENYLKEHPEERRK